MAAFGAVPNIKTEHWQKLTAYFENLEMAWKATAGELRRAGLNDKWINNFIACRADLSPEMILSKLNEHGIKLVPITGDNYPQFLKEIYNPPFLLYQRGDYLKSDDQAIAIVGSRRGTDYGKRITFEVAKELAKSGVTVISGLAIGLDTEAHKGALAGGGRTIAVLANGLERIYPSSNTALGNEIARHGCLLSEQPLGMPPLKQNFPARNRLISGLSQGVLVSEAGENSGTLHTASFALEQNRQIYAVPGPVYNPLAKGPNNLLKKGAKAVTEAGDILEDFGLETTTEIIVPVGEDEELIFQLLKDENLHIDDIARRSKKASGEISKVLTMMEIKGKIRHLGGMVYSLRK